MSESYQKIFVALDGSSLQGEVLERAIAIAQKNHAELLLGHVVDSVPYEASGVDFDVLCTESRMRLESELAEQLDALRNNVEIPSAELSVRIGRINDTLIKQFIEPFNPDLVICGERGYSTIKYAFIGSVSTYLVRNAPCDVLVVKQKEECA